MRRTFITAALLPIGLVVASCGDDDPGRTTAAYCEDLEALDSGEGGPIDPIFEEYGSDPTLDEWATGLPDAIAAAKTSRDEFADVEPSEDLTDQRAALLDAFGALIDHFEQSLVAARAGDQAAFDAAETRNMEELSPAMGSAMESLMEACGSSE